MVWKGAGVGIEAATAPRGREGRGDRGGLNVAEKANLYFTDGCFINVNSHLDS